MKSTLSKAIYKKESIEQVLQFQRVRVHDGQVITWQEETMSSHCEPQARSKGHTAWSEAFEVSRPTSMTHLQNHTSSQTIPSTIETSIQIHDYGAIPI